MDELTHISTYLIPMHQLTPPTLEQLDMRRQWIQALTSGEYRQGQSYLKTTKNEYCCLGVLCAMRPELGTFVPADDPSLTTVSLVNNRVNPNPVDMIQNNKQHAEFFVNPYHTSLTFSMPPDVLGQLVGLTVSDMSALAKLNDSGYSFAAIAYVIERMEDFKTSAYGAVDMDRIWTALIQAGLFEPMKYSLSLSMSPPLAT